MPVGDQKGTLTKLTEEAGRLAQSRVGIARKDLKPRDAEGMQIDVGQSWRPATLKLRPA